MHALKMKVDFYSELDYSVSDEHNLCNSKT